MSSPDHDEAMRIAAERLGAASVSSMPSTREFTTLAYAYRDVVRDAITPEEARAIVHYFDVTTGNEDFILTSEYSAITKLRRIAARAATTKEGE